MTFLIKIIFYLILLISLEEWEIQKLVSLSTINQWTNSRTLFLTERMQDSDDYEPLATVANLSLTPSSLKGFLNNRSCHSLSDEGDCMAKAC